MSIEALKPSKELYDQVRGGFVARNTSLTAWCREHGHSPTNARSALVGAWNGPKAKALRVCIIKASGMSVPSFLETDNHSSADRNDAIEAEEFFYWGC